MLINYRRTYYGINLKMLFHNGSNQVAVDADTVVRVSMFSSGDKNTDEILR